MNLKKDSIYNKPFMTPNILAYQMKKKKKALKEGTIS